MFLDLEYAIDDDRLLQQLKTLVTVEESAEAAMKEAHAAAILTEWDEFKVRVCAQCFDAT